MRREIMRLAVLPCLAAAWLLCALPVEAQTPMRKVQLMSGDSVASLSWTSLASDPNGDGLQARLPDAKELLYAIDSKADLLWFKVITWDSVPEDWFGISVAFDSDDKPDNGMTWWGTNKNKFDRIACAFLFKADDHWQGYAGVGDSESIGRGNMTNLTTDVKVAVDRGHRALFVGVPRSTLGSAPTVRALATVGSMVANNDDVPNEGMVTVKLKQ
jgi:hypothetical protein